MKNLFNENIINVYNDIKRTLDLSFYYLNNNIIYFIPSFILFIKY